MIMNQFFQELDKVKTLFVGSIHGKLVSEFEGSNRIIIGVEPQLLVISIWSLQLIVWKILDKVHTWFELEIATWKRKILKRQNTTLKKSAFMKTSMLVHIWTMT